jgi:hypothetical protein
MELERAVLKPYQVRGPRRRPPHAAAAARRALPPDVRASERAAPPLPLFRLPGTVLGAQENILYRESLRKNFLGPR